MASGIVLVEPLELALADWTSFAEDFRA